MPVSTVNASVVYNSETEILSFSNLSTTSTATVIMIPYQSLVVASLTGCSFFYVRIYKNGVMQWPFYSENQTCIVIPVKLFSEPESLIQVSVTNLDPLQTTHRFEASLS